MISLEIAHDIIKQVTALDSVVFPLEEALGRICAEDVYAVADCPTVDSSLKDGFAVIASEIEEATEEHPVDLYVSGTLSAGDEVGATLVGRGEAVRIMTGAQIPSGATSVVASEFAEVNGAAVRVQADAAEGRNILRKGSDIKSGQLVLCEGTEIGPAQLGYLASAGIGSLLCHPSIDVAVVATGSELVWPGEELIEGKVTASNMVAARAELMGLGCKVSTSIFRDNFDELEEQFKNCINRFDLLITCGGVLDGDKDLTMKAMERLGMEKMFHRVRIGPGKGACFGRLGRTLVCNLPGGPPSNHVALLLLALPACRRLMGVDNCFPAKSRVVVQEKLHGQKGWTQLVYCRVEYTGETLVATPLQHMGRLAAMAAANALVELPESCGGLDAGGEALAWIFSPENVLYS
ncbi:molybdopterin molybdotransferase MoeA [Desulforhopalus sp. 52FAK]